MSRELGRREFLGAAATGTLLGSASAARGSNNTETPPARQVRLEFLRPKEIAESQAQCPTIFQPLGTIEWHGLHNVVGVDAVKAHALCVRAAQKGGGLVCPALYGGVGGLSQPHTFIMDPENSVYSYFLRPWLEQLCREFKRDGFKAIIILTGHYGAAQQIVVRETAVRMSRALGMPVLGTPEYILALDAGYTGDHAAWGETSLMMHLYPDTVDLTRLGDPPYKGVGGRDPKESSAEDGRMIAEKITSRLATLAKNMPAWDRKTLDRFIDAESALVARQLSKPRGNHDNIWAAWQNLAKEMKDYGKNLAEENFEAIKTAAEKL